MEKSEVKSNSILVTENIPVALKERPQWVCWKMVPGEPKPRKVPMSARTGREARTNDPSTWAKFSLAADYFHRNKDCLNGLGFVFSEEDALVGIDIDGCVAGGQIEPWAQEYVDLLNSYTELSPSETGLHILVVGKLPSGARKRGKIEMYESGRYFTVTGHLPFPELRTVEDRTEELKAAHKKAFPVDEKPKEQPGTKTTRDVTVDEAFILERAPKARNGAEFTALMNGDTSAHGGDHSAADLALCNLLAFWTREDSVMMDSMFRRSGLMRDKWNEVHRPGDRATYGQMTIQTAIEGCTRVYEGPMQNQPVDSTSTILTQDQKKTSYNLTDSGNAERLVAKHGEDIRFCQTWGKWLLWIGKVWEQDDTGGIYRKAKTTVREIYREAADEDDDTRRKAIAKHARASESAQKIGAMIHLTAKEAGIPIRPSDLDADQWKLNVLNGTIDLRAGKLGPHRRGDLITKLAPVEFDPDATCPKWLSVLDRAMDGNQDLVNYIRTASGYSLTGDTSEKAIIILHGTGDNAKTVITATLGGMLGDYSMETPVESLMVKKNESIPNDIARLKGARLVTASEGERGQRLAESLIKKLSGGDKVTARFMRAEYFEFTPEFKIWLSTNHKPIIRGNDQAIWNRIHLVPFLVSIPKKEQIPRAAMMASLKEEWPGILAWAVRGCLQWQKYGLQKPKEIEVATAGYRAEMDVLENFIECCCVINPLAKAKTKDLFATYESWCLDNREERIAKRTFTGCLRERGLTETTVGKSGDKGFSGIGLKSDQNSADFRTEADRVFTIATREKEKVFAMVKTRSASVSQSAKTGNVICKNCKFFVPNVQSQQHGTCGSDPHDGSYSQSPSDPHDCGNFRFATDGFTDQRKETHQTHQADDGDGSEVTEWF